MGMMLNLWKIFLFIAVILSLDLSSRAQVKLPDSTGIRVSYASETDSLLSIIDGLHDKASEIEVLSKRRFDLNEIKSSLPAIVSEVHTLGSSLRSGAKIMDLKSLETFSTQLMQSQKQLEKWRSVLLGYSQKLFSMEKDIEALHQDSLLKTFLRDTLFARLYTNELTSINRSWRKAQKTNVDNVKQISALQQQVSTVYYQSKDMQKELKKQIQKYSARIFGEEFPWIWQNYQLKESEQSLQFINAALQTQQRLVSNFFRENILRHIFFALAILAGFIIWVRRNRSRLLSHEKSEEWKVFTRQGLLSAFPILSGLIIVFNLSLFFDLNPPQAYIALLQFCLLIVSTIFIFKHWPLKDRYLWIKISTSLIAFQLANSVLQPGIMIRLCLLSINIFMVYLGWRIIRSKYESFKFSGFANKVGYIFLILNLIAILLNIFGRVTLSKTFTNAAISGLIQIIALSMFTAIIKAAFLLQATTASVLNHGTSKVNYDKLNKSVSKLLDIIVLVLWSVVFASNMNIYNAMVSLAGDFLFTPHTISSTTFSIGNILFFILVIYLSTVLQKYVGYLFGENEGTPVPGERKGSKVVVIKLIIIIVGFLLAIMVSGLPVDKITVILGAFGVGIGLGLQTIVNNFVSGIILIFERPLQIGDYVEVSGYKGWVNDIGIRATRISSGEGAEILVPNGTILSGNLVNWTLSNSQIRIELNLKITPGEKIEAAKAIILDILSADEDVIQSKMPEVFNQAIGTGTAEIKIWFWIRHFSMQQTIRSRIFTKIYEQASKNDILIG